MGKEIFEKDARAMGEEIGKTPIKPFADLMNRKEDVQAVFVAIQRAVHKSFVEDAVRDGRVPSITENEIKHRFRICEAFFRHCRGDLGFGIEKTCDLMAQALRSELDGISFDPTKASTVLWTPT